MGKDEARPSGHPAVDEGGRIKDKGGRMKDEENQSLYRV